ncbi:MAG TPA: hypothetical protein VM911_01220 [Pyrinomonadaceae bacterium]|jgi:hypothetical protein|nr:hypothetical protein [Pyrinomonadaceae bacterium]
MKRCPKCGRTYANDTFSFCLEDGSILSSPFDPQKTLVIPSPEKPKVIPLEILSNFASYRHDINIVLDRGVVTVNNTIMRFPSSVKPWERLFGEPNRRISEAHTFHIWDDLGLRFREGMKSIFAWNDLRIFLNLGKDKDEPDKVYKGRLLIDGSELDCMTTVDHINNLKQGKSFRALEKKGNEPQTLFALHDKRLSLYLETDLDQIVQYMMIQADNIS